MAIEPRPLFSFFNWVDDALTLTSGGSASGSSVAAVAEPGCDRVFAFSSTTAPDQGTRDTTFGRTWIEADLGGNKQIQLVGLIGHTMGYAGQWRVRLSQASDFSALEHDSGVIGAWPTIYDFGLLGWGEFPWGGDLTGLVNPLLYPLHSWVLLDEPVNARYLRIDVLDSAPQTQRVQITRLWCGPAAQPGLGMAPGYRIGWEDDSRVQHALGGGDAVEQGMRRRVASVTFENVEEGQALAYFLDLMDRRLGVGGDLVFMPQPTKPEYWVHEALYCRQQRLEPLDAPTWDMRRRRTLALQEIR